MGTPWTAHNVSIPAYPNVFTPDPTGRYIAGSPAISPTQGPAPVSSPRQALVITGADIAIQPVVQHPGFEHDMHAPTQEGPLAQYPTFSVIDPSHKWQRIRDWASKDSATATGAASAGSSGAAETLMGGPPANAGEVDVTASIDSTLLELELERARASLKAAAAAGGPGGTSSVAAAISAAAAAAAKAIGVPPTVSHSAGGALGSGRHSADLVGMSSSLSVGAAAPPRSSAMPPREPSFGGFGTAPTQAPTTAAAAATALAASNSLHAQGSFRQTPTGGGPIGPEASSSSMPAHGHLPPVPPSHHNPLRYSTPVLHGSARADALHASLGAVGEVSALLHQQAMATPGTGGTGGSTGSFLGRGSLGITGYVQSMQHAQAAFTVERTALEARCRAAEEALAQSERRYSVDVERLQSRVSALESGMAAERQLCGQLQHQLQGELKRLRAATEAEAAARAAESAAKEMLNASNQSLELERRRTAEAAEQAAEKARELSSRVSALEAERAGLEKQLLQEKTWACSPRGVSIAFLVSWQEHASTLHKQLRDAQRQEQALMEKLGSSEGARQQQEMRLEAAAEQVAAMRNELQLLNAKLAARDKQLLKHVQEVEETQLAALRTELGAVQSRLQRQEGLYAALRTSLAAIHQALGPQSVKAVAERQRLGPVLMHSCPRASTLLAKIRRRPAHLGRDTTGMPRTHATRLLHPGMSHGLVGLVALPHQALAAAFGYSEGLLSGFTAAASDYGAVADRLLSQREVAEEDATAVVQRVKELVTQTRSLYMASEKREVALTAETDQAMSALRQTNTEAEARLASCNAALRTATQRVEELAMHLQESRNRCSELEGSLQAAQQAKQAERRRCEELQDVLGELQEELSALRMQATEAEAAQRELSASREQAVQLQQQMEQLNVLAQRSAEAAEIKEGRIRELRAALASALDNTSAAEGQTGMLLREKQQVTGRGDKEGQRYQPVLEALDEERRRSASLEAVVQSAEQQLDMIRSRADAVEASYQGLCQQVVEAAKAAASQARELQQAAAGGVVRMPLGTSSRLAASQLSFRAAEEEPAAQLAALENVLERLARSAATTTLSLRESRPEGGLARLGDHDVPQLSAQQAIASQHLQAAHQHLQHVGRVGSGGQLLPRPENATAEAVASASSPSLCLHELAQKVLSNLTEREAGSEQRVDKVMKELAEARQEATKVAVLQERLAACEAELGHVKATAQAEFDRVQGEVTKAFLEADKLREAALADAEGRARAAEQMAADAAAQSQAQVAAVEAMAEARVRDAEAARSAAVALVTSLQEELAHARSLLDAARAELQSLQEEQAAGLRHVGGLNEQIRRLSDDVTRWRKAANPRTRERMVLLAKVRILRRKRTQLQSQLTAEKHRTAQLSSAVEARRERIRQGLVQMRQMQIDNVQLSSRVQEAESRATRADALVSRLEERRINVEQDRKAQAEKAAKLAGQLAEVNKALEAARKAEAAARKDMDRIIREQLEPQQRRTATVLEELERAAQALQESQANATRLLQQGEALRSELAEVKRAAEEDSQRAQERLTAISREVTDRDTAIASLRQQLAAAQASAAAAAALLPAVSSGQLGDAAAVQAHLIGQLGHLQAANAELEARRTSVETELEVLRVRLSRAEALSSAGIVPATGSSPSVPPLTRSLGDLTGGVAGGTPQSAVVAAATLRDDGSVSARAFNGRDQDSVLTGAKDQRIHELRAALASVMAERAALQRELASAREESGAEIETQGAHVRMLEPQHSHIHRSRDTTTFAASSHIPVTVCVRRKQACTERWFCAGIYVRTRRGAAASDFTGVNREATGRGYCFRAANHAGRRGQGNRTDRALSNSVSRYTHSHVTQLPRGYGYELPVPVLHVIEAEVRERQRLEEMERRLQQETAALEKRVRDAERAAADAASRGEERLRQAERAREQLSQMQALHASAEEAVRQLSSQLRELQQGNSSQAHAAAAEVQQLQAAADSLRLEAALAKDNAETNEAEIRRLTSQNEAAASQARALASQLQASGDCEPKDGALSDDLAAARTRMGCLQQELMEQKDECDTLHRANEALQASLAAAEERHLDSESQLVEAEAALSRQQGLVRQVQAENERLHAQYGELQQQLQQLAAERQAAVAAAATAARALSPKTRSDAASLGARREGSLETRLLEAAVSDLQAKLDALQADLMSSETRAGQAEQDAQLLQTDLDAANSRLRAAEAKVVELQGRLEASMSGSTHGVSTLKEKVLELELQLDEQRDREEAAQAALARTTERCDELQVALAEADRRAEELRHRCEDKELEVGVLQAQLATASAQRLAQQAEAQQVVATHGSDQAAVTVMEFKLREKALLVDALQTESGKLAERLSEVQGELLEAQEARDKTAALLRTAEARLAEERSEVESLRRQLAAASSQGRGADLLWVQRAAEAEDAVVEAAAAHVRSAGLETRAQDLEAALAEAETRAAAAADAETRTAAALAAEREAHLQEVTALQLQVQGLQGRLAVCERQVADRDARLEGVGKQLSSLRGHTEAFEGQLKEVRQELRAALQENETLQRRIASAEQEAADAGRRGTLQTDGASVSGLSISTSSHAPQQQLVGMLTENRDLLEKLTATHSKLKQARAKLAQWEQELRSKDLEVERLRAQVAAAGGTNNSDGVTATLRSELQAYKAALAASQEEAAASAAAAAEAQARCEALTHRLQQDGERRASHSQASSRAVEHASPSMLERLQQHHNHQHQRSPSGGSNAEDAEIRNTLQALMQKIRAQRSEIESLTSELQAANTKRTELAKEAATLDQRLAEAEIRERDLAATAETLRQQLVVSQQQLETRQLLLQQLRSVPQQQQQQQQKHIVGLLGPPSPSSASQVMWERGTAGGDGPEDGQRSASPSPRSQATRPYHSTRSAMSPSRGVSAAGHHPYPGGGAGSSAGGGGVALSLVSASYSSQHQLLLAQQHQQQATKLDRVVAMWRDACRAKDARVQELQADLTTFSTQLERARADASALTAKVLEREQALTSCQHQLELTRDSLGAQLQAAEDKLEAKGQRLAAVEDELQGREEELREVRAQLQAAERSLLMLQAESGSQREATAKAVADLSAAMRQVAALQAEVQELQQRSSSARSGAQQMTDQVYHLQEQLNRSDAVVGRLLMAVRTAMATAVAKASAAVAGAGGGGSGGAGSEGDRSSADGGGGGLGSVFSVASLSSQSGSGPVPGNLTTSLRLLEELTAVLVEELQRRGAALVAAEAEVAGLQSRLAAREEDVKRLEARLKSAQDSLTARLDEVSRLQTALRRKEADCEAVETEISAQIADYQRLKQRLLQQERDSSRLSSDQEALLRRGDELEAALAAKQEECALLMKKCAQLEEQWQAGRSAMAALQERVRSLDAHSEALQRNSQAAALARQDAAAALDTARAELRSASQQAAAYREQLEMRNNEVRELNSMLQAWEAMRLGKDAQIAALLERCKRHEEDAAEKARTIEALRRKLQAYRRRGQLTLVGALQHQITTTTSKLTTTRRVGLFVSCSSSSSAYSPT
ncbi:hypothetical protein VOLCADRAFT_97975 [Volvox carteri f. nagariensis]|uniref:Uncharacterized protein n=1 Tax=Volvox carteri f. nagariensis TaxID=3068 RepID=D8UE46_VOLCA|nr:uncharacterized protein VOLCADRAFT_97975 [Volvox carteri f. nagariensis]EFJ42063.1 hypothetical protein VOLCADRAFT_97975 [Volvox carteri f. nagariensis]|eukprot:XP_002956938.1 hypothetical protein VOLCADRAFT_97975 [Volvox carteri f. nagariensis]